MQGTGRVKGGWGEQRSWLLACLLNVLATCEVYLRDGSDQTSLRAATLR